MIIRIALRNLLHDRVRLAVTLTGVVFAVVLIAVQGGLFVGFTRHRKARQEGGKTCRARKRREQRGRRRQLAMP